MKNVFSLFLFFAAMTGCTTLFAQSYWSMSGNSASSSNFIGTTNNVPFQIKTNNNLRMILKENLTGIGINNPIANLHVHSTAIHEDMPGIEPFGRELDFSYDNSFYMTSPSTGATVNDGFAIKQEVLSVTLRQFEDANLNIYGTNGAGLSILPEGTVRAGQWGNHAHLYMGSYSDYTTSGNTAYLGFNVRRNGSTWYLKGNGAVNGGALVWSDASGNLIFANIVPTGGTEQQVAASNMNDNINLILYNNGLLQAKEVKVTLTGWPDYVFDEGYKLMSLGETEQYIKKNGHLPGVPSAQKVEAEGLSLGEMNARLMQKVEELTLHMIELQKQIDELKGGR